MAVDLYGVICVSDYSAALAWYERLLGSPLSFVAGETEAVWELAPHRSLAIEQRPEHAGHTVVTIFLEDFDTFMADISSRGIEPAKRDTYDNGVRKALYVDPDGNEIGFGGGPLS